MATPPPYAPDPDRYAGFESGTTFRRWRPHFARRGWILWRS